MKYSISIKHQFAAPLFNWHLPPDTLYNKPAAVHVVQMQQDRQYVYCISVHIAGTFIERNAWQMSIDHKIKQNS